MKIGILKEQEDENRVVMLPETVASLVKLKVDVAIEKGAGHTAFASDEAYTEAGGTMDSRENIVKNSDILLQISPFTPEEVAKIASGKITVSLLNPFFNKALIKSIADAGITSFGMEMIPRTTRAQSMDVLSSQATVAGYKAVLDAAGKLPHFLPMFMTAAGTIKPAKMLILGAGVAGLQAIATARKLGAVVEVFDVRSAVKEEVQSLGGKFIEVEGAREEATAGGYAVEQTEEFKEKQRQLIHDHAAKSDIVICTAQIPGRKAPLLLTKATVEAMRAGSIVIDLAASTGGNCELTKNKQIVEHNQVSIVGQSDYPSDLPSDSSKMFGLNVLNFLKLIIDEEGNLNLNFEDDIVKGTCVTHNKEFINERVKEFMTQ